MLVGQASGVYFFGVSIGIAIGLLLSEKVKKYWDQGWFISSLQTVSVIIGLFASTKGMAAYPSLKMLFALGAGFWLSFLGAWSVQKLSKTFKKV